jgi:predicted RNase H-like nuclease (RuvC/YqgF family)
VNKLAEIINRKDFQASSKGGKKVSSSELRKKEKENRKIQQELTQEKEKFSQMVAKYTKDINDLQALVYEEGQKSTRLQMEIAAKDSEMEQLKQKVALNSSDTASVSSTGNDLDDETMQGECWATGSCYSSIVWNSE